MLKSIILAPTASSAEWGQRRMFLCLTQDLGSGPSPASDFLQGKSYRSEFSKMATNFNASVLGSPTLDERQERQNSNLSICQAPSTSALLLLWGAVCLQWSMLI